MRFEDRQNTFRESVWRCRECILLVAKVGQVMCTIAINGLISYSLDSV